MHFRKIARRGSDSGSSFPCRISWAGVSTGLPAIDGDGCQGFVGPDPSTLLDEVKMICKELIQYNNLERNVKYKLNIFFARLHFVFAEQGGKSIPFCKRYGSSLSSVREDDSLSLRRNGVCRKLRG